VAVMAASGASACHCHRERTVEQLAAVQVLHDQQNRCRRVNDFVQLDDVWMAHALQDLYLAGDALHACQWERGLA